MARSDIKTYDPINNRWVTEVSDNTSRTEDTTGTKKKKKKKKKSTDPNSARGKAEKQKNKSEYYTLSGNLSVLPTVKNIQIKTAQTLKLCGFGKWLSGKYYVSSITRRIDGSNGYSEDMEVLNPDFRKQIKKNTSVKKKAKKKKNKKKKQNQTKMLRLNKSANTANMMSAGTYESDYEKDENVRVYVVNSTGDTLWNIAKRFYGDSSKWTKLYDYDTGEKPDPLNIRMGMRIAIP